MTQGESTEAEVTQGESTEAEVAQGESTEAEVTQGEVSEVAQRASSEVTSESNEVIIQPGRFTVLLAVFLASTFKWM